MQVISARDGWPLWVSPVRPGREHDTTCARTHGLIDALNRLATTVGIPTLTDLGYENAGPGFRHPVKKPKGHELGLEKKTFNRVIRGIHGVAERANALPKVTFKALRRSASTPRASPGSHERPSSCSSWNTAAPPERSRGRFSDGPGLTRYSTLGSPGSSRPHRVLVPALVTRGEPLSPTPPGSRSS